MADRPVAASSDRGYRGGVEEYSVLCDRLPLGAARYPEELYEAAKIDGGGRVTVFRYITVPLMMPFIGIGITSASITAINIFDEIVALAGYKDLGKNLLIESYLTTFSFLILERGALLLI